MVTVWFKMQTRTKCGENIWKFANAPSFYNTASPQVGSALGSKHYKQFLWLQIWSQEYSKAESTAIEWFKCKLGLKFGENIRRLSEAPGFWHTTSPQVGSGRGSKPLKHSGGLNTIVDTTQEYLKAEAMAIVRFKMQIRAEMWWKYLKIG